MQCDDGDTLISCKECSHTFHLRCLSPPLEVWICTVHITKPVVYSLFFSKSIVVVHCLISLNVYFRFSSDMCFNLFHLKSIPEGDWQCRNCSDNVDLLEPIVNFKKSKKKSNFSSSCSVCSRAKKKLKLPEDDDVTSKSLKSSSAQEVCFQYDIFLNLYIWFYSEPFHLSSMPQPLRLHTLLLGVWILWSFSTYANKNSISYLRFFVILIKCVVLDRFLSYSYFW